jgi:hypothetical protein
VVVAVAGVQVVAEATGDLVDRPVAELMAAEGDRGLQVLQQLAVAGVGLAEGSGGQVGRGSRVGGLPIEELLPMGGGVGAGSA